jgi:Fe-S-cluster containining protein
MFLLDEDIKRITALGYVEDFFDETQEGFKVLKNSKEGRCVFHDGTKCTIYENRPKGCKLYPIIFDIDYKKAVKDSFCPYRDEFRLSPEAKHELSILYPQLLTERLHRIKEWKRKVALLSLTEVKYSVTNLWSLTWWFRTLEIPISACDAVIRVWCISCIESALILSTDGTVLKVLEAYTRDVGRGVVRLDYDAMDKLDASTGDVIEIKGKRKTVGKSLPLYPSDEGRGVVRIDGLLRNNSGVAIGDSVTVRQSAGLPFFLLSTWLKKVKKMGLAQKWER